MKLPKPIIYFVAYVCDNKKHGNGDLTLDHPIRNGDDLRAVEVIILAQVQVNNPLVRRVALLNWRKFDA